MRCVDYFHVCQEGEEVAANLSGYDSRSATLGKKLKALKAPVVVFGVFVLCWLPHYVIYLDNEIRVRRWYIKYKVLLNSHI